MVKNVESKDVARLLGSLGAVLGALNDKGIHASDALILAGSQRGQPAGIPISIFNSSLGALESIVKYMREELLLDYATIASMLGKNPGPIGVTYRRSLVKLNMSSDVSSKESIAFEALRADSTKGLSVFESVAIQLARQGHDWHEIAQILHRHDKTVWTVLDRAKRKMSKIRNLQRR